MLCFGGVDLSSDERSTTRFGGGRAACWLCQIFPWASKKGILPPRWFNPAYQHKKIRGRYFGQELFLGMKIHLAEVSFTLYLWGMWVRQRGTGDQSRTPPFISGGGGGVFHSSSELSVLIPEAISFTTRLIQ